ncbi:MAG: hypothetical protein L3J83_08890 [Proteobacteria bacterium]|nr:hypothetical protein [Pseudomonadota bacterium]
MKSKILMVLVLLIFVGQVVSAPLKSCLTENSENSEHSMVMADMDHHDMSDMHSLSMHDSGTSTMQTSMQMDCCQDECQCPVDMCFSMAFIDDSSQISFNNFTDSVVFQNISSLQPSHKQDSLYRPPILS